MFNKGTKNSEEMHFLSQFPTLFNFDTGIGNFGIYAIRLN